MKSKRFKARNGLRPGGMLNPLSFAVTLDDIIKICDNTTSWHKKLCVCWWYGATGNCGEKFTKSNKCENLRLKHRNYVEEESFLSIADTRIMALDNKRWREFVHKI